MGFLTWALPSKLIAGVAALALLAGATGQATGQSSLTEQEATDSASSSSSGKVTRWTKLSNQRIIDKIHDDILPEVEFQFRRYRNPVTSAYVKASEGGFGTNCNLPAIWIRNNGFYLRSFNIDTNFVNYVRCGFAGGVWEGPIKPNEFRKPLKKLGNSILNRSRVPARMKLPNPQNIRYVGGPRRKIKVKLECRKPSLKPDSTEPTGVKEIVLTRRGKRATIYPCP